jgi:RNA polymerase sigma-70 factor, ECF subfamily
MRPRHCRSCWIRRGRFGIGLFGRPSRRRTDPMNTAADTPDTSQVERDLLARVSARDHAALRLLYDRFAAKVMGIAHALLRDREEAEEVVQETFTAIWHMAASFDASRGPVRPWIFAIARNHATDRLRARRSTQSLHDLVQQIADAGPTPHDLVATNEDGVRVRRALAALPDEQRSVLTLAYFHGLSQTQIAAHTGEPLGTVKTRVRLAMQKLGAIIRAEVAP